MVFYCFFPRTKYHACIDLSEGVVGSCKILCKVLMATDYEEKLEEQKLRPNSDSTDDYVQKLLDYIVLLVQRDPSHNC